MGQSIHLVRRVPPEFVDSGVRTVHVVEQLVFMSKHCGRPDDSRIWEGLLDQLLANGLGKLGI